MPTSFSQALGFSGSRVSMLTATTSKSGPPSFFCRASSAGISLRQGTHQVAQRLSSTVPPLPFGQGAALCRLVRKARPARLRGVVDAVSAATSPRIRGARRLAVSTAGRQAVSPPGLRARVPIPYTAASPAATPANPPIRMMASRFLAKLRAAGSGLEFIVGRPSVTCHEQQDVGRALRVESRRDHGGDQRLDRLRPAPLSRRTSPRARRTPQCWRKQGIITADDAAKIAHGLDTILSEIENGALQVLARARRHPHECREPAGAS